MTFEKDRIIPSNLMAPHEGGDPSELSVSEECKVDNITANLHRRIEEETEKLLKSQLQILCGDMEDVTKKFYPNDEFALATFFYKNKAILSVRISENWMGIEFDTPKIPREERTETQEREVQNENKMP